MTVAVVVDESAAGVPACLRPGLGKAGLLGDVGKGTVTVVFIKRVLAVVSDKQIVITIVVIIADAASLSPTGFMLQTGAFGYVGECAVAVILEEVAARFLPRGETFQPPAVY